MTYETVRVRFRRPYQGYRAGQIVVVSKGQGRSLELFGKADIVREPQIEFAVAAGPAGVEVAIAPEQKRKRGRPKKVRP